MSHRKKRLLEKDHEQESSTVKKKCMSLVSDCTMKVPIVQPSKKGDIKKPDRGRRSHQGKQEHTLDDGSVQSRLSPPAHNELITSDINPTNNHHHQEDTIESRVCTSPLTEGLKVPVVRLFRLNIQTESQQQESTKESDREQHCDQEFLMADQQEGPTVNNSYTSFEALCGGKQPVVKLSRLETQLNRKEEQLSKLDREQYLEQVPSPSNSKTHDGTALSPPAQNAVLPSNICFTMKHDQQEGVVDTVCLKQPVVQLIRLNIKTKHQVERLATTEGDSEHHHDLVQPRDSASLNMQPENREEQSANDSDSDQFDEQDLENFSAYELERLKNIKENAKFLNSLKLIEVASELSQKHKKRPLVKREKRQRDMAMRRSVRLLGIMTKIQEKKKQVVISGQDVIQAKPEIPPGPIKMIPSNNVDHGAWISFQDTWKSISNGKFVEPTSLKCRKLSSYKKKLKSMTLEERAVTPVLYGSVTSVALHPSKTRTLVAAGDIYGNVGLWDLKHQSAGVYVFPLHSRKTCSVAFSPSNSKHLLSLGCEGTIRCGDVSHAIFDEIYREKEYLTSFDFLSADGSVLIVSHFDSKLSVVDRRTPTKKYDARGCLNLDCVRSVSVHPLKRDLCLAAGFGNVFLYDVRNLSKKMTQPVMLLHGHTRSVLSASFSPGTGTQVLTCSRDSTLRVFTMTDLQQNAYPERYFRLNRLVGRQCFVPVKWDPKQENCFGEGLSSNGILNIFHTNGSRVHTFSSTYFPYKQSALAIHPTRNLVVAGTLVGKLCVWKKWKNKPDSSEEN